MFAGSESQIPKLPGQTSSGLRHQAVSPAGVTVFVFRALRFALGTALFGIMNRLRIRPAASPERPPAWSSRRSSPCPTNHSTQIRRPTVTFIRVRTPPHRHDPQPRSKGSAARFSHQCQRSSSSETPRTRAAPENWTMIVPRCFIAHSRSGATKTYTMHGEAASRSGGRTSTRACAWLTLRLAELRSDTTTDCLPITIVVH